MGRAHGGGGNGVTIFGHFPGLFTAGNRRNNDIDSNIQRVLYIKDFAYYALIGVTWQRRDDILSSPMVILSKCALILVPFDRRRHKNVEKYE